MGIGPSRRVCARHRQCAVAQVVQRWLERLGITRWRSHLGPGSGLLGSEPHRRICARHRQCAVAQVVCGGWSGWESLGGVLTSGPGVSSWSSGRLDVFVQGHGQRAVAQMVQRWLERLGISRWSDYVGPGRCFVGSEPYRRICARHRQRVVA